MDNYFIIGNFGYYTVIIQLCDGIELFYFLKTGNIRKKKITENGWNISYNEYFIY